MTRTIARCLSLLLLCAPPGALAAFFFRGDAAFPVLEDEISYREDRAGHETSIDDLIADLDGWVSQKEKPFRGTGAPIRLWARVDVPAQGTQRKVFLRTGAWERAEFFVLRDGRVVGRETAGTLIPWPQRRSIPMTPAAFHAGLVAIDLPARSQTTILARLATDNRFVRVTRLRFSLWDAAEVLDGERSDRLFQCAFHAVMLALMSGGLAFFLRDRRERSYAYFVLALAGSSFIQLLLYGVTVEALWPSHPAWDYYAMWIAIPVALWSFAGFSRHYLATGRGGGPGTLLKWAGNSALLLLPAGLLPLAAGSPASLRFALLGTMLASLAIIASATAIAIRRAGPDRAARWFLAAMLCCGAGVLVTFASWVGVLPEVEWTLDANQVGLALAAILLSVGLVVRSRERAILERR